MKLDMNTPSRRTYSILGTLALALTALAPHPARAQMLGGMGPGSPGFQNGRPMHGGAGPAVAAPQMAAPSPPRMNVLPGMGGGMPARGMNPAPGFSNNVNNFNNFNGYNNSRPMHGGADYSPGAAYPAAPVYGPQNVQPDYGTYHARSFGNGTTNPPARADAPRSLHGGADLTPPSPAQTFNPGPNPGRFNNYNNGGYFYAPVVAVGGPALLGGYYYGNYCDTYYGPGTLPTVYSVYDGFPQYIYSGPGMTITTYANTGVLPTYIDPPQAFQAPQYTVNYNQNNYYVANDSKAADLEAGGDRAKAALPQAFPADSYQAALADIERAWTNGDLTLLTNHFHSDDTKISVLLRDKYKYSINSSDFGQITRDAFDRLNTLSFKFTEVRKAKNGDITGFGKHVYTVAGAASDKAASGDLVPFDSSAPPSDAPDSGTSASGDAGTQKTVYVSYTLRHGDGAWYIVGINSSPDPLAKQ